MSPEDTHNDIERNQQLLRHIKEVALSSVYWSEKVSHYHLVHLYEYAPMVEDELFQGVFLESETVGTLELEKALGRKIAVEELIVCPLSVNYLIFDRPTITGSQKEYDKLCQFQELVIKSIRRNETRAINNKIRMLQNRLLVRG